MAFQGSANLAAMFAPASRAAVESEIHHFLAILGEADPALVAEVANTTVSSDMLTCMHLWNAQFAANPHRDRIGREATKFFAAQTLATTIMASTALDTSVCYSSGLTRAMAAGADGLFEVGRSQFEMLGRVADDLLSWASNRALDSIGMIESPLGNSLPVQIVCDLAKRRGISCVPFEWNSPRNDRPSRGRTVTEAARACVDAMANYKLVVLMDEALTGTRFIKLFDALADKIGRDRFLPIVMRFTEQSPPSVEKNPNWERLFKRVMKQGQLIGYPNPIVEFPTHRLFKLDAGKPVYWHSPIMWGNSDLIAGKRKVNLIFTLLNHCFTILEDLGTGNSRFSEYLEHAWEQDMTGAMFRFAPGTVRSMFSEINDSLPLDAFKSALWEKAKDRFPEEYKGEPFSLHADATKERWEWLREAFLTEAQARMDEQRAIMAWRAFDNTFAASFSDHKPTPNRDNDASPYTFPLNSTIAALNLRLRERIGN